MKPNEPSDSDILDDYIDILQSLCSNEQIIWREFRTIRHFRFHCLFWDGSEEGFCEIIEDNENERLR